MQIQYCMYFAVLLWSNYSSPTILEKKKNKKNKTKKKSIG